VNGYKLKRVQMNDKEYMWYLVNLSDNYETPCTFGFVDLIEEAYQIGLEIGLEEGKNDTL